MAHQEDVYTITDQDILASIGREESARRAGRAGIRPDRTPSPSMLPRQAGGAAPFSASTISLFVCGAGQMYNGQGKLGVLLLLTQVLGLCFNWAVTQLWPGLVELGDIFGVNEWRLLLAIAAVDFLMIVMMLSSVHQAYRRAEAESGGFQGIGNPVVAGLASLVLPGWGQLANAQPGKAMAFLFSLFAGAFTVVLLRLTPFLRLLEPIDVGHVLMPRVTAAAAAILGLAGVMWILSVYDAMLVAGFRRRMD
ncbi:MAG TPA: hypothetical protein VGK94_06630 [Candidatus Polarisedimenticolia bacterium]|jgi:TM2 domain-containing membrane protein YozV